MGKLILEGKSLVSTFKRYERTTRPHVSQILKPLTKGSSYYSVQNKANWLLTRITSYP
ncbi:hypothetical protein N665_0157s0154 [Sinapis alba]|nr:hypothetical protein N665_0157s0154 [Sinapis alba]